MTVTDPPSFRRRLPADTPVVFGLFRRSLFDYLVRTGQMERSDDMTTPAAVLESWTLRVGVGRASRGDSGRGLGGRGRRRPGRRLGAVDRARRDARADEVLRRPRRRSRRGSGAVCSNGRSRWAAAIPGRSSRPRTREQSRSTFASASGSRRVHRRAVRPAPDRDGRGDLAIERVGPGDRDAAERSVMALERVLLGHTRGVDTRFLLAERPAWLARREGRVVGMAFGLAGDACGPIGALDPADVPALMATVETRCGRARRAPSSGSRSRCRTRPPSSTRFARGFRLDTWFGLVLSSSREMQLDRYILTQPTYIL